MGWTVPRMILGALAGVFALMLLGLPLWRFTQGRLAFREAVGFWIAGSGFGILGAPELGMGPGGQESMGQPGGRGGIASYRACLARARM